ncbi:hypothetical protein M422DRAFT_239937 [Sphaerobolus stellatus SS14]|nr:hypothetical protein M422DRAFT_239937 [Sphaerobolus stellatus SS14]
MPSTLSLCRINYHWETRCLSSGVITAAVDQIASCGPPHSQLFLGHLQLAKWSLSSLQIHPINFSFNDNGVPYPKSASEWTRFVPKYFRVVFLEVTQDIFFPKGLPKLDLRPPWRSLESDKQLNEFRNSYFDDLDVLTLLWQFHDIEDSNLPVAAPEANVDTSLCSLLKIARFVTRDRRPFQQMSLRLNMLHQKKTARLDVALLDGRDYVVFNGESKPHRRDPLGDPLAQWLAGAIAVFTYNANKLRREKRQLSSMMVPGVIMTGTNITFVRATIDDKLEQAVATGVPPEELGTVVYVYHIPKASLNRADMRRTYIQCLQAMEEQMIPATFEESEELTAWWNNFTPSVHDGREI